MLNYLPKVHRPGSDTQSKKKKSQKKQPSPAMLKSVLG